MLSLLHQKIISYRFHTDRNCPTSEHIPIRDLGKAANKRTLSKHILFMKFFTFVLLGVLNSRGGWVGSTVSDKVLPLVNCIWLICNQFLHIYGNCQTTFRGNMCSRNNLASGFLYQICFLLNPKSYILTMYHALTYSEQSQVKQKHH